ncbi:MAG: tetratricopeptide repeat protein [Phycisphaerales bacterium]|nr:tetratricopeptide repeat protein [Phycisphaerales bacterium]
MAMRPRTFRRLVLSGVLLGVIVLGAIGYFVIAPIQERRTVEKLRVEGMKAYESGDYAKATKDLRRYLRNTQPNPPAELLTFARSQARVEAGDGGHLRVSIDAYRSYLVQRPDDIEASQELLSMFNRAAMWPEAKNLATSLRTNPESDRRLVLSGEITARRMLDRDDPELQKLFDELIALGDTDFSTVWGYWYWLESTDRALEALEFVQAQIEAHPDRVGPRVLRDLSGDALLRTISQPTNDQAVKLAHSIMQDIAWDRVNRRWNAEAGIDSPDLAKVVGAAFDALGFNQVSLEVFLNAAQTTGDRIVWAAAARRMYWAGMDERLLAVENNSTSVLGFRALAARRLGREQVAEDQIRQLEAIDTDFRTKAWINYLQGEAAHREGREIEARGLVAEAIDIHDHDPEPMFYQTMGEIYAALGFEEDAIDAWKLADRTAGLGAWTAPTISIIGSLIDSGHYADAGKMATDFMRISDGSPQVRYIWLTSQMAMAQNGMLDEQQVQIAITLAKEFAENSDEGERAQLQLIIAELFAIAGDRVSAQGELSRLIASNQQPLVVDQILRITRDYDLGMIDQSALDTREIAIGDPNYALGYAMRSFTRDQNRDSALEVFSLGEEGVSADQKLLWDTARAQFLDAIGDDEAKDAWEQILKQNPEDIKLLYAALDSQIKGTDRPFVEATIKRIMELTSSKGRAEPIRLRLARARAIAFGGTLTKTKRDEALSIVRSVIATDPKQIKARLLLSTILDMDCSPLVAEGERFESDPEAAAAEKLTISRLIAGPASRDYLFDVSKLNVTLGDNEAAKQNLLEAYARSEGNLDVQFEIIKELRRAGEFELAIPRLENLTQLADGTKKVEYELVLARLFAGLNQRSRMLPVLQSIARSPRLTSEQHTELMNLYVQSGYPAEAEQVLAEAEKYGLSPAEVLGARVKFARLVGNHEQAADLLRSIVDSEPTDVGAWIQLARLTQQAGSPDQAIDILEEALVANPENELLQYDLSFMRKDPDKIVQVVQSGEEYDEESKLAMQQIAAYEQASTGMDRAQRTAELERIARVFPKNAAVQGYVYDALLVSSDDLEGVGLGAEAASRRIGRDNTLLSIAAKAYTLAGNWPEVLRVTSVWRGATTESTIEPDIYAARANFEMKDYQKSRALLAPYIDVASKKVDEPLHRELLVNYASTLVKLGESGPRIASEFEPIARSSELFRNTVWLGLARDQLREPDEAVRWIQLAQEMSTPETLGAVADAWLGLSKRFPMRQQELTDRALDTSEQWLASYPGNPYTLAMTARALLAASEHPDLSPADRDAMQRRALSMFDEAAAKNPADLNNLFQAAQIAKNLGDHRGAISRYEHMLGDVEGTGIFGAAVKNNLARVIELESDDPARLAQAADYAREAIGFQEEPAFFSTLGWIELKRGNNEEAVVQFQKAVAADPDLIDAWAGLSVALTGHDESGARQAVRRVESLIGPKGLDPILEAQMKRYGVLVQVESEVP